MNHNLSYAISEINDEFSVFTIAMQFHILRAIKVALLIVVVDDGGCSGDVAPTPIEKCKNSSIELKQVWTRKLLTKCDLLSCTQYT